MKIIFLFLYSLFLVNYSFSQGPEIQWQNTIGGSGTDNLYSIQQTSDGGYILGGFSYSDSSGDKLEDAVGGVYVDYWIVKTDGIGFIQWENTIGGNRDDFLQSIEQTTDGGYILGGYSESGISGDKTEPNLDEDGSSSDYWVLKLDALGAIEWQNTIGGNSIDKLRSVKQTSDGGYILGGESSSDLSGDKTEEDIYGGTDYWVIKLSSAGIIEWQNTIGGTAADYLTCIQQTIDGGFIVGGRSFSVAGFDKTEGNYGSDDYWVLKLNSVGNIIWQNTIGGNHYDHLHSIEQTSDGGFILGGTSTSNISGDKTENVIDLDGSGYDYWVVKLNATGTIIWQNTIGGTDYDELQEIKQTFDGGYIIGGWSESEISGDKTEDNLGLYGDDDYWIIKLNETGNILWQNTIGGSLDDILWDIEQTADAGFILGGHSKSPLTFDKTEDSIGGMDYWIIKLASDCSTEICNALDDNCNGLIDDGIIETISISAGGPTTFCQGGSVLLTATYSGVAVQWKKNGANIPGATSPTYNATHKATYSCQTISPCGTAISDGIFVNVQKNPPATITAGGPTTFCEGGSVILTANAGGGLSYQWYKSATAIPGANSINYTATISGNYKCRVTKTATGCFKNSNTITVTVPCKKGSTTDEQPINNRFEIYPNPNNGKFNISVTSASPWQNYYNLEIYNSLGELIFSKELCAASCGNLTDGNINETISIDNLSSGIYFLRIADGKNYEEQKLIIE
ncbi:MAG: T9SS type A sorting domain-containing protein [Chitinophagales bacterium]